MLDADFDFRSALLLVGAALLAIAGIAVARDAANTLTRIAIGVIIALALDPVVVAVRRRFDCRRGPAVAVVALGVAFLFASVAAYLGPRAAEQAAAFNDELPQTVQELQQLPVVGGWLERSDADTRVQQWVDELPASVSDETIARTADQLLSGTVGALVVVFTVIAVLMDGEAIVRRARRLLPERHQERADEIGHELYRTIGQYFGGSLTVAVLMGLFVLTLGLVFGIPLAPLAAIWAMLTDLVPQVGGFLGGALLAVLALAASPGTAVIVVILYIAYMNLENHIIQPAIVGEAVNLTPPTTMLAAFIGGAAAGVPGALVATPLVGAAKRIYLRLRWGVVEPAKRRESLVGRVRARFRPAS